MKPSLVVTVLLVCLVAPATSTAAPCRRPSLHINKEQGRLSVRCGQRVLHSFAATFGKEPLGPKRERRDGRTPEGSYKVCSKARFWPLHIFLNLDYPNRADADRALERGQISYSRHRRIIAAHRRNRCPRGITPLGSGIGIHGAPRSWARLTAMWQQLSRIGGIYRYIGITSGCILLANADLDRLWPLVESGETRVVIEGQDPPRTFRELLGAWSKPRGLSSGSKSSDETGWRLPLVGLILRLLEGDGRLAHRQMGSAAD